MFFNINDANFYAEEEGQGKTIVLIHGNPYDTRIWKHQIEILKLGYHVVAYDIRGTGQTSNLPNMPFSHVSDLEGIFNALGLMDAYLVGLSLGGLIASNFAFEHAHRVKALVLVSSDLAGGPVAEDYVRFLASLKLAMRTGGPEKVTQRYLASPVMKSAMAKPKVAALLQEMLMDAKWDIFSEHAPSGITRTITRLDLSEIKTPTLVLYGADDIEKFKQNSKIIASEIPDAGLVAIPNSGHFPNIENPDYFNSQLIRFFDSI